MTKRKSTKPTAEKTVRDIRRAAIVPGGTIYTGKAWEYHFFIDVKFDDYARYKTAIAPVKPLAESVEILGEYTEGEKNTSQDDMKPAC